MIINHKSFYENPSQQKIETIMGMCEKEEINELHVFFPLKSGMDRTTRIRPHDVNSADGTWRFQIEDVEIK